MASNPCLRCFERLSITAPAASQVPLLRATASRSFTSSSSLSRDGKTKTLRLKRQKRVKGYKVPAIGERKALRKRIVLSNSNALQVLGLVDFPKSIATTDDAPIGKVVALPDTTVDALRSLEAFKPNQSWSMFNRPATLFRQDTLKLIRALQESSTRNACRRIITGPRGCGKSVFLLQAHTVALQQGWIVIHLPEAITMANATTAYAPIPNTNPTKYSQPRYTAALLARVAKANSELLANLTVRLKHSDLIAALAPLGTSLLKLAEIGAADVDNAWPIFEALWAELTVPNKSLPQQDSPIDAAPTADAKVAKGKNKQTATPAAKSKDGRRPPIMLTLDGIAAVSRQSSYLAPDLHHVHAFDLSLVEHFMNYLSGAKQLPNGGSVLAADSLGTRFPAPSLDLAIRHSEQKAAYDILPKSERQKRGPWQDPPLYDEKNPFERQDERVLRTLRKVPITTLSGLSREEAQTMLEYYARSGMLRARVTNALVAEKWALSGGGIIRELERSSVGTGLL